MTCIELENLDHATVNEILSDTLHTSPYNTYSLATLICNKTNGNPFFVGQMLKSLRDQELISFCNETLTWKWDGAIDGSNDLTESVIQLLRQEISKLGMDVQLV